MTCCPHCGSDLTNQNRKLSELPFFTPVEKRILALLEGGAARVDRLLDAAFAGRPASIHDHDNLRNRIFRIRQKMTAMNSAWTIANTFNAYELVRHHA